MLVMTLLVRDEEDIIQENIDFHLSMGIDYIIATDNMSVDRTPSILKEYERRGVLLYIKEPDDNYSQAKWVTRMARLAYSKFGASWVINNDADEFWIPANGDTLRECFEKISEDVNILRAKRHNFFAIRELKGPFLKDMIYRELISLNPLGNPLPPKVAHRASPKAVISQGNHTVRGLEKPNICDGIIEILHFPVRTYTQLVNKIRLGGEAYERNSELPLSAGSTWRRLYSDYRRSGHLREYFERCSISRKEAETLLHSGKVILDTRLADYFQEKLNDSLLRECI